MASTPLDDADLTLLRELQRDARQTNRALASTTGLAPSTTLTRVRELERRRAIIGYHAEVDLNVLGRSLEALIFVRLQPKNDDIISSFIEHMWELPETIAVSLITGVEDVVIHIAAADAATLQSLILNEVSNYPGVFDERTSLLFEHRRKNVIDPI
ncbi:MAG: Lrp/AsnC family transcriptional regulator [Acidimicrobiales bacterium]